MTKIKASFYLTLSASATLLLTGCSPRCDNFSCAKETTATPNKQWTPPKEAIPTPKKEQEVSPEILNWLNSSEPLDVAHLVDIALRNNATTKQAWAAARSAAFGIGVSESAYYPTLAATGTFYTFNSAGAAGATSDNLGGASGSGNMQEAVGSLSLSYLLFDFGQRRATLDASKQGLFSAGWLQNQAIQDVMLAVLTTYYQVVGTQSTVEAQEINVKDAEANVEAARTLYKAGIKTTLDVIQAESTLINAQLSLETLRSQLKIAFGTLANALGVPATTPFDVKRLPKAIPCEMVSEDVDSLIATAKLNKPDLAATQAMLAQQEANLRVAKSSGMPTLSANLSGDSTKIISGSSTGGSGYLGSVVLSVPLFNGFSFQNQTCAAKSQVDKAKAVLQGKESEVVLDVLSNYYTLQNAKESIKYNERYLKYAQEAYDIAFDNYKQGVANMLDLLYAQSVLAQARAQEIQAKINWMVSLANLAYSAGILTIPSDFQTPQVE